VADNNQQNQQNQTNTQNSDNNNRRKNTSVQKPWYASSNIGAALLWITQSSLNALAISAGIQWLNNAPLSNMSYALVMIIAMILQFVLTTSVRKVRSNALRYEMHKLDKRLDFFGLLYAGIALGWFKETGYVVDFLSATVNARLIVEVLICYWVHNILANVTPELLDSNT